MSGDHLYLFGFLDRGDGRFPRFLARLPLAALDAASPDLPAAIETLGAGGRWLPGLQPDAAQIVMDDDATEMSVVFITSATGDGWRSTTTRTSAGRSRRRVPPTPCGRAARTRSRVPGRRRGLVFRIPELAPGHGDPNTGCYAAKEQPAFSRPGSATFTYVCNLFAGPREDPFTVLRRLQRRWSCTGRCPRR